MGASWYGRIARETFGSSLTPVLSLLAFLGLFATRSVRQARPFYVWLGAMLIFVVAVGYGNRHPWYQLPLVPIAAAFAGALCASVYMRLSNDRLARQALSLAVIVTFGLFSYACVKPLYRETAADLRTLGLELKRTVPAKSLVVAADYGDPTVFYYAERTGWHFLEKDGIYNGHPTSDADAIADLEGLKSRGATHFVVYSGTFWWLDYYREFAQHLSTSTALMKATPEFKIYRLDSGSARPRD